MRSLIAGNWKMHGTSAALAEIEALAGAAQARAFGCDTLICPPASLIARAVAVAGPYIQIGAQDCHPEPSGPFTGDISAEMLADAGARVVIVGHSERRHLHGETNALVRAKAEAAWRAGLAAIVCAGETEAARQAGETESVVARQLAESVPDGATPENTLIAYEPVWAIGSGRTPSGSEITAIHVHIRALLAARFGSDAARMRILYGGSLAPANAAIILRLSGVDGALVGTAALCAQDFLAIVEAAPASP